MGFIYRLGHINKINMKFGVKSLGQGHVYCQKKILWHKRAHRIFNDIGYLVIFYRRL